MKAKHIIIVTILIAVAAACYIGMKKVKRTKLEDRVRDAFGDIPGMDKKSDAELQEMLNSRK